MKLDASSLSIEFASWVMMQARAVNRLIPLTGNSSEAFGPSRLRVGYMFWVHNISADRVHISWQEQFPDVATIAFSSFTSPQGAGYPLVYTLQNVGGIVRQPLFMFTDGASFVYPCVELVVDFDYMDALDALVKEKERERTAVIEALSRAARQSGRSRKARQKRP